MYVGRFVIFEFHLLYIDGHPYIGNGGGLLSVTCIYVREALSDFAEKTVFLPTTHTPAKQFGTHCLC